MIVPLPANGAAWALPAPTSARGITATTGVTLGGQTFGTSTATGTLAGRSTVATVHPAAGAYAVRLPPASAAMLTLSSPPA